MNLAPGSAAATVRPYSAFASSYDHALGGPAFRALGAAFDALVRHYGIGFRSAADLGCGTGRFARHLATRHGVPVTAVDRSAAMLRVAARRVAGRRVRLLRQDIRRLCLSRPVDLVVSTFDTINHLVDDGDVQQLFHRVRENLNPGGFFLFDAITPHLPLRRGDVFVRALPAPRAFVLLTARWIGRSESLRVIVTRRSCTGSVVREVHPEKAYSVANLDRWLRRAGFLVRGIHDAATLSPAHQRSPRVVFVAQRLPKES